MCQNLQVQVEELKSVNESLNLSVKQLTKAREIVEATLGERDEMISAQCKKMRLLEEQSEPFYEVQSEFDSEKVHDTQDNSEKDLILNFRSRDETTNHSFEEDRRMFLAKNEFLEKVSSSVQKEYNDLLASNDVLKQRLETKFKFLKHDNSLEKMFEMIEKEYESNVSKISMSSSTFESKNLELVKEMGDKVKYFDKEKKMFETKISKLEKDLTQRVKDFDDVKTEGKNNDLRTSYHVLKEKFDQVSKRIEKYETYCEELEKENNDLKMHYKRLFDSIKQKKVDSQVFTKSIPKVNVSEKIYTGKSSKPISKKLLSKYSYDLPEPELIYPESSFQFRKVRSRMNENDKVVKSDKNMMKKNQMISKMKRLELKSERLIRKDERSIEIAGSTFAWNYFSRISTLSSDNQSLLLQYSRDGYVIEGELKDYEDSCEKSSVQIKFKVKDFIQAIKESSCKRRSKLAFENADFEFESESSTPQDYPSSSPCSQLLQVVINEKPGPVVDSTQMVVDNRIDLDDILGFENQYEQVAKKGDEGLVKQDDMLVLEEGVNRLDYGKEENDESEKTQEKVFVDVKIYYVQSFKKPW
ncbi:hypothetical protein Tco_1369003 [Tanacetum coccineum]